MNTPDRASLSFSVTLLALVVLGLSVAAPGPVIADTIYLKNGQQILDCKIVREDPKFVSVRTPVGDMTVPRDQIHRIQRVKTVYDRYTERRAALNEKDVKEIFKLGEWCRRQSDLRKESDELLGKVIALSPKHVRAHQLLGHVRVGRKWYVPEPLKLRVRTGGLHAPQLRENFKLFLASRRDVKVLEEPVLKKPQGSVKGAGKVPPLAAHDVLDMSLTSNVSTTTGTKFFGQNLGNSTTAATVNFQASSRWLGSKPLKTRAVGQVPKGGNIALGIQNAFGRGSVGLNRYLDKLIQLRVKVLAKEYRKNPPREPARTDAKS